MSTACGGVKSLLVVVCISSSGPTVLECVLGSEQLWGLCASLTSGGGVGAAEISVLLVAEPTEFRWIMPGRVSKRSNLCIFFST
jgi:hypothetical protein